MRRTRVQFRIWWAMAAVAVAAVLLASANVVLVAAVGMVFVASIPVACAPRGRRYEVMLWVGALHPVMVPVYSHAAWLVAWGILGHRPTLFFLDQPESLGLLVLMPSWMGGLSFVMGPIAIVFVLTLAAYRVTRQSSAFPLTMIPLAWGLAVGVLAWDPLGAFNWLMG